MEPNIKLIVKIIFIVSVIVGLGLALFVMRRSKDANLDPSSLQNAKAWQKVSAFGISGMAIGLFHVTSAFGIGWIVASAAVLSKKNWGRILFMVMSWASLLGFITSLLMGDYQKFQEKSNGRISFLIVFVLFAVLIFFFYTSAGLFFNKPDVKNFFKAADLKIKVI